ncbi:hypothetical protein N040_11530 [Serratia marcescens EGD-HP20]|nr:hypothetical protein N040_11530 [Serratia marcescens EGD-HP20]
MPSVKEFLRKQALLKLNIFILNQFILMKHLNGLIYCTAAKHVITINLAMIHLQSQ